MENLLKVGDKVNWRGAWGSQEPKEVKVISITKCESNGCKFGYTVPEVEWDEITDRNYLVDLDNGHWAWGFQIDPQGEIKTH